MVDPTLKTPPPDLPKWREYFERMVSTTEVTESCISGLEALTAIGDVNSLPVYRTVVLGNARMRARKTAVCEAHALTENDPKAWDDFVRSLGPLEALPAYLQGFIQDETKCHAGEKS